MSTPLRKIQNSVQNYPCFFQKIRADRKIAGMHEFEVKSRILRKNRAIFEPFQERTQKASCKNKKISEPLPHQAAPAEHSWRGVLRVL
ncbi:MAG: hypothetical protein V8T52_09445 [Ruminococcus sp.]